MKRFLAFLLTVVQLLFLSACIDSRQKTLTDSQVRSIAVKMNEEINFLGKMNGRYNLQYSNFHYETDGYNRYIAALHYQYEDKNRNYHSGDVIVYFKYIPETDTYEYKKTNIAFPALVFGEEHWITHIKQKEDFGWGSSGSTSKGLSQETSLDVSEGDHTDSQTKTSVQNSVALSDLDYSGQFFNDYINFQICKDNATYTVMYMEERKIVVDGIIESSQYEVRSSNYQISLGDDYGVIIFTIDDYSYDYNGTIALKYTPSNATLQYSICVNIPSKIMCKDEYLPVDKVPS